MVHKIITNVKRYVDNVSVWSKAMVNLKLTNIKYLVSREGRRVIKLLLIKAN